ncbi:hypothetical protein AB0E62_39765 [Streptomyces sp. NPDC038707]|uniref:hypothetical protein n=1 Tax=Streptomyces sp. NPDC038707 TaxID=3154329 RepID=UPI00340BACF5
MITFSFEPRADDVSWSQNWRPERTELIGGDFCLRLFTANLRLVVHGADLGLRTPGLPVVDFALMLDFATRELETVSDFAVETSVSQKVFAFSREGTEVTLTTNYAPSRAKLTWSELRELTGRAKAEAVRLIVTAHPELRDNTWLKQTMGKPPAGRL